MRPLQRTAIVALTFVCLAAPAHAIFQPGPVTDVTATSLNPVQLDCFRQYGGYLNPQTGRWMMKGAANNMQQVVDAVYGCVAQKTGRMPAPFLSQYMHQYP
jgi:hypothetical protein